MRKNLFISNAHHMFPTFCISANPKYLNSPPVVVIVETTQHLATPAGFLFALKLKGHFLTELYDVISEESSLPTLGQG